MSNNRSTVPVQYLTRIAILGALASILFMIEIPVIAVYKLDLSTIPVLLGAFSMGPMAGLGVLLIKDLTGMLHSSSMCVGELADFLMTAAYVLPAALIYKHRKTRKSAVIAMVVGVLVMVPASVLVNWQIMFPFYQKVMHFPMPAIIGMFKAAIPAIDSELKILLFATAPFNLLKGVVLSVVTYLIYKPLSPLLHVKTGRGAANRKA